MIGRSHGVHAEPITFGPQAPHLAWRGPTPPRAPGRSSRAHCGRQDLRFSRHPRKRATPDVEDWTCEELGLAVAPVSNQIVQRDRHAHFVCTLALIASSLDKFATELRSAPANRDSRSRRAVRRPVATAPPPCPTSAIPRAWSAVSGLARLLRSHAQVALENVHALAFERDISHSSAERIILPDACLALDYMLYIFNPDRPATCGSTSIAWRPTWRLTGGLIYSQGGDAGHDPRRHVAPGRLRGHAGTRHRVLGRRRQLPGRRGAPTHAWPPCSAPNSLTPRSVPRPICAGSTRPMNEWAWNRTPEPTPAAVQEVITRSERNHHRNQRLSGLDPAQSRQSPRHLRPGRPAADRHHRSHLGLRPRPPGSDPR